MTRYAVSIVVAAAALAASIAHADPRTDVQGALTRIVDAGGFVAHVNGHVFGPGLPVTSGDIDVLFPDRIHARTETIDAVMTPAGAWVNLFGAWTEVDREQIPVTAFSPSAMRKAIASIDGVRAEGSVMTTACEQRIYRFRANGQLPGAQANGDVRLWICDKDGKPERLEATDAESGAKINVVFDWSRRPLVEAPR
jgi:hypothetical protein